MADGLLLASGLDHVVQHVNFQVGEGIWAFPILSNHIVMQFVALLIILWVIPWATRQRKGDGELTGMVPTGLGNAIEAICVFLRNDIAKPNLGHYTDRFIPFIWSTFFFILTCNILGMLPLADWTFFLKGTIFEHQIGGTSTGNIWVTGALAALVLVLMFANGLRYHGMEYVKHFFMGPPGINVFIAVLEIMGNVFKAFALAIRLFANMVAGHILLATLISFVGMAWEGVDAVAGVIIAIPVIAGSVAIFGLEIFVALLQAFVFTTLTCVFIGLSVNIHHEDEHHEEEFEHARDAMTRRMEGHMAEAAVIEVSD